MIMMKKTMMASAIALTLLCAHSAQAQGVATEQQIHAVQISGTRSPIAPNLPSSTASLTAEELRLQQNIFNPEDALRNLPNTTIRKRYTGDRNALIGGRSFGTTQAARGLVLMDGYLLSNFLGRFDAPRWNMLNPEEIERVDVIYGPFSAIYPGNSIGTTVLMTTRKPKQFETAARFALQSENFESYEKNSDKQKFTNTQISAMIADRLKSGLWYRLSVNQQDSTGHPMQYYTVNANAAGVFSTPSGNKPVTAVTGVIYDIAPTGQKRAVFGASGGAIDHTVQNTVKTQFGYDFTPTLSAEAMIAYWDNDSTNRNRSFMRDANNQIVWSGRVSHQGNVFDIPATSFAPFTREEANLQTGFSLKTRHSKAWNWSLVASQYHLLKDEQRNANNPEPIAANGGAGTITNRDGTRFRTLEIQTTYTPTANDWGNGQHSLSAGVHANDYRLRQTVQNISTDWRVGTGTEAQYVSGDTQLLAAYAQDAWRFQPDWKATIGARWEAWNASNGVQRFAPNLAKLYPERDLRAFSPKAALTWEATDDISTRLSFGRGTRFATVAELFQGSQTGNSITINDPNLKPEQSSALEWMVEKRFDKASLRASVFQDRIRDTIWSQTNVTVFPNVTNVQNVDLVRTRGIELVGDIDDVFIKGLKLDANLALNQATVLENKNYPASVGKVWVRIPKVRTAITLSYAANTQWNFASTVRYAGRQYNDMLNLDIHPDTYGGMSRVKQMDVRAVYRPAKGWQISAGIDNVFDYRAFQSHPLSGRNLFAEIRYAN